MKILHIGALKGNMTPAGNLVFTADLKQLKSSPCCDDVEGTPLHHCWPHRAPLTMQQSVKQGDSALVKSFPLLHLCPSLTKLAQFTNLFSNFSKLLRLNFAHI